MSLSRRFAERFTLCLILCAFSAAGLAEEYTPGPVTDLHEWLGDQCSFVPDLDVGTCCAIHDMAYQNPSQFPFPNTTPGTERHRRQADLAFRQCIIEHNRFIVAQIYYVGVRLFGWAFYNYQ